jgi:hypothetical protein
MDYVSKYQGKRSYLTDSRANEMLAEIRTSHPHIYKIMAPAIKECAKRLKQMSEESRRFYEFVSFCGVFGHFLGFWALLGLLGIFGNFECKFKLVGSVFDIKLKFGSTSTPFWYKALMIQMSLPSHLGTFFDSQKILTVKI